jgi:hypothetical protein
MPPILKAPGSTGKRERQQQAQQAKHRAFYRVLSLIAGTGMATSARAPQAMRQRHANQHARKYGEANPDTQWHKTHSNLLNE